LPYELWDCLQITIPQAALILATATGLGFWLMEKSKTGFKYGLIALVCFVIFRAVSFIQANNREQIIIYNVPQKQAIDFIDGRKYLFIGDSDLLTDDFIRNFHIKPSRVLHRIEAANDLENFIDQGNCILYKNKKIMLINKTTNFIFSENKIPVDLLLISGNPKLYFNKLANTFSVKQVVFDGSCPAWKINYWKKDCDSLHIPYHDVSEKGAFVMNLR